MRVNDSLDALIAKVMVRIRQRAHGQDRCAEDDADAGAAGLADLIAAEIAAECVANGHLSPRHQRIAGIDLAACAQALQFGSASVCQAVAVARATEGKRWQQD